MNRNLILLIATGALGIILLSLAMNQGSVPRVAPPVPADAESHANNPDAKLVKAMVARALEYMDEHGTPALIEKVNAAVPEFYQGEHYVFILDHTAAVVAHPIYPIWIGVSGETGRDIGGTAFITRMATAAAENPDGTWFNYRWSNPVTGKISTKSSWVVMRDNHIIGAGIYLEEE